MARSGSARASTALFALAACAAFGLAIRDTALGRASGLEPELAGDPAPPLDSGTSVELARDGVPSAASLAAAELAEAEAAEAAAALAAFERAALRVEGGCEPRIERQDPTGGTARRSE
jgi:hypothetical protein